MGWQAEDNPRPGEMPGQGEFRRASLGGFQHDGALAGAPPSAALAVALETAAGPDGLYEGADIDAMVGIVRQWAAIESWAAAGKLAALRAMMREDGDGQPLLRRRADLPDGWDDSLNYEVAAALAMGPVSAAAATGHGGLRAPRASKYHRNRNATPSASVAVDSAALRRPAGRLGTHPANNRHVETYPPRRPATDRALRRRAHPRLRSPP